MESPLGGSCQKVINDIQGEGTLHYIHFLWANNPCLPTTTFLFIIGNQRFIEGTLVSELSKENLIFNVIVASGLIPFFLHI